MLNIRQSVVAVAFQNFESLCHYLAQPRCCQNESGSGSEMRATVKPAFVTSLPLLSHLKDCKIGKVAGFHPAKEVFSLPP